MYKNQEQFLKSLSDYLKKLSRNVMRLNTHNEVFKYLNDTFMDQLKIDIVIATFIKDGYLEVVHASGDTGDLNQVFPLLESSLVPESLRESLIDAEYYQFKEKHLTRFFERNHIKSWFSLPIFDGETVIGIYYLGYHEKTKLYEQVGSNFDELGSYIATALLTIRRIEESQRKLKRFQIETENQHDVQQRIQKISERVVQLAGSGTQSHELGIYLYDDVNHHFNLQPTTYGFVRKDHLIEVEQPMPISNYFPNLELIGFESFSYRLMLDNQVIGLIYARKSQGEIFTRQDSEIIAIYGDYFLTNYANLQLLYNEANYRRDLERVLDFQQNMINFTITEHNFSNLNTYLLNEFGASMVLFDQFFNILEYQISESMQMDEKDLTLAAHRLRKNLSNNKKVFSDGTVWELEGTITLKLYRISDGQQIYGYLGLDIGADLDREIEKLVVNTIKNVYTIQFVKQRIEWNAKEQVQDHFVESLLSHQQPNLKEVLEYANNYQWDLMKPHQVGVIDISVLESDKEASIIEIEATRQRYLQYYRHQISNQFPNAFVAVVNNQLVVFLTLNKLGQDNKKIWENIYRHINNLKLLEYAQPQIFIGIGEVAKKYEAYPEAYKQAVYIINILKQGNKKMFVADLDDLGSYPILSMVIKNEQSAIYVNQLLGDLYRQSIDNTIDFYKTFRVYLHHNGNIQETADALFIHRSTLTYRLDKIREIIPYDIEQSQVQFDFALAYKLADLYGEEVFQQEN